MRVAALLRPESFHAVKADPFTFDFDPEVLGSAFDLWGGREQSATMRLREEP